MRIDVITIFPGLFDAFLGESFLRIARERGLLEVSVHDLRDWAAGPHRRVDDSPYGGGPGMLMTPEPLVSAIEALGGGKGPGRSALVVLMTPQGRRLDQRFCTTVCANPGARRRSVAACRGQFLSVRPNLPASEQTPGRCFPTGPASAISLPATFTSRASRPAGAGRALSFVAFFSSFARRPFSAPHQGASSIIRIAQRSRIALGVKSHVVT